MKISDIIFTWDYLNLYAEIKTCNNTIHLIFNNYIIEDVFQISPVSENIECIKQKIIPFICHPKSVLNNIMKELIENPESFNKEKIKHNVSLEDLSEITPCN